jgi:phage shock protein A
MHEKIKKLSGLVDKLIEQNFKLKTESKSLRNSIMELRNKIERLEQDNQRLIINSSPKKNNE